MFCDEILNFKIIRIFLVKYGDSAVRILDLLMLHQFPRVSQKVLRSGENSGTLRTTERIPIYKSRFTGLLEPYKVLIIHNKFHVMLQITHMNN